MKKPVFFAIVDDETRMKVQADDVHAFAPLLDPFVEICIS
jgi:hypothetical protein